MLDDPVQSDSENEEESDDVMADKIIKQVTGVKQIMVYRFQNKKTLSTNKCSYCMPVSAHLDVRIGFVDNQSLIVRSMTGE